MSLKHAYVRMIAYLGVVTYLFLVHEVFRDYYAYWSNSTYERAVTEKQTCANLHHCGLDSVEFHLCIVCTSSVRPTTATFFGVFFKGGAKGDQEQLCHAHNYVRVPPPVGIYSRTERIQRKYLYAIYSRVPNGLRKDFVSFNPDAFLGTGTEGAPKSR